MKIVFFGTPNFAATNLNVLINAGYDILGIVCPPDSKKGRGKQLKPCAVKEVGIKYNIPVLQPLKLRDNDFKWRIKSISLSFKGCNIGILCSIPTSFTAQAFNCFPLPFLLSGGHTIAAISYSALINAFRLVAAK